MSIQELEITIDKTGKVLIRVKGVKGSQCTELTKKLESALGELEERTFTEEYYEEPPQLSEEQNLWGL